MIDQCPQIKNLPENVRKFWEDKQVELEDTLIQFSYAIVTDPSKTFQIQKSGLLYLMKRNLWFEDFQKVSAFSFFIRGSTQYKKTLIQIPVETIEDIKLTPKSFSDSVVRGKQQRSGFFQKLFCFMKGAPAMYLLISGKEISGTSFQYAFGELDNPDAWLQVLSEVLETRS